MAAFEHVESLIDRSLALGFPGGQLIVEKNNAIIYERNFGSTVLTAVEVEKRIGSANPKSVDLLDTAFALKVSRGADVTAETLFDIASLTKIFAVTYLFQYYASTDAQLLDRMVGEFFQADFTPRFHLNIADNVWRITVKELLSHHAGFEPNPLFYDPQYSTALYCQTRADFLEKLLQAPQIHPSGQKGLYSDVDFMLLTFILEQYKGASIETQLTSIFWKPLGLTEITYTPLAYEFSKNSIAATERNGNSRDGVVDFPNIRSKMIQGAVQDEKAYHCMEGISGHAGLFSNARSLLKLLRLMYHDNDFFSHEIAQYFLTPLFTDNTFGLGWRLNGEDMRYMFGDFAGAKSFGHTGWTGCLATRDPKNELTIVYLTNRKNTPVIHPIENMHLFYGDRLPAGKYINMIHAIYQDLGIDH